MGEARHLRALPQLGPANEFFWTSGEDGRLRFLRCTNCRAFAHPPSPVCPSCRTRTLVPEAVSGRATVLTYTLNFHSWGFNGAELPYVVAIVAIDEDPAVRLTTNVIGCDPQAVHIGMRVAVRFEQVEDVWIPLFAPVAHDDRPAEVGTVAAAGLG